MNIPYIIIGLIFLIFGFLFYIRKINIPYWYESKKSNEKTLKMLCHNIGRVISLCGFLFFINGIFHTLREHFFTLLMISWVILALLDMLYISTSKNYRDQF